MATAIIPDYSLHVSYSLSKKGKKVATIRILGGKNILWRTISADINTSREDLYDLAVQKGKEHCRGFVARQLRLPLAS